MLTFYLFRMKVYEPRQTSIFDEGRSHSELIADIIRKKPSGELRKGHTWHIGNVTAVGEKALYFALGRTTKSIVALYDNKKGDFVDADFETSPYTHAILDLSYQVLAIAKKASLAPTPRGIAKQLERLANSAEEIAGTGIRVEISQINDPTDLIKHIFEAYAVTKFTTEFGEPNVWDANQDFQKPMQKLIKESSAKKGKTTVLGKDLNRETLEKLTRATAATGNDAHAMVKISESARGVSKHLKGNPAVVSEEDVSAAEQKKCLLEKIRQYYRKIRKQSGEQQ